MIKIDYMVNGEIIKTEKVNGFASTICLEMIKALELKGTFTESGFDPKEKNFWIIKDCGDNCIKIKDIESLLH